ncbi:MAG: AMP-binding protein [Gammaproteobacteria bacterium]|nr:AMP-binding protein [Gammaproteobacteria bacterium]
MSDNLFSLLSRPLSDNPARLLLSTDDGAGYTREDLDRITARFAGVFAGLDLSPGDRVAVQVDKSPESLFLYLACLRYGLVFLPLNTAYQRNELAYFIGDAEPALVVSRPDRDSVLRPLLAPGMHLHSLDGEGGGSFVEAADDAEPFTGCRRVDPDDSAAIVYTSGTTGRPKGAMITHGNLASNARTLVRAWEFTECDTLLHVLPLFHVHGLFVACHCALLSGGSMRFLRNAGTDNIIRHLPRATVMMGVPTHYTRLLGNENFDRNCCTGLRLFISGSAPLTPQTFEAFERRTGHVILERYGMTETGMNTSNPLHGPRVPGTVGPPLPGIELRIIKQDGTGAATGEIGVLQVKGPNVFRGYWRQPERTAEEFTDDGWFITGDLASTDERGYVRIEGRHKDLVISGGYNVYPKEVELCIDAIPGVVESAVVGLPHPDFGEAVSAVVVREPDCTVTESGVIDHVKRKMAAYKAPKTVHFVDELPRNAMGKIQKNVLRAQLDQSGEE